MKFSFINPDANVSLDERESKKSFAASPPLGILYLASVLNQKGVEVSVLDQPAKSFTTEETVNWVINENPDVLGFSTLA
ncbi:cobalamin-dependent protein, partial [Candidatus Bathyarchaeota archaeon]|nr:cobalamin-dependent protein [Candidatus Bathyarchaeota archaeon]